MVKRASCSFPLPNERTSPFPHPGSQTPKLHAAKAAEEWFFTCSKGSMRPATSAQLRFLPVDGILLAAKQRFSGRTKQPRPSARVINSPAADLPRWLWQGRLALAARPGRPCHIAFYALTGQNACKMRVSRGLSPPCHLVKSRQTSVKNDTYKSPAKFLQNRRRSERESNRRPEATRGRFAAPAQKPPLHGTRSLHIQFALQKIIGQSDGSRP